MSAKKKKQAEISPEKKAHLDKLALAVFGAFTYEGSESWALGVDSKRPFGNSIGVESDILEELEIEPAEGWDERGSPQYSEAQEDYALELWGTLIDYLPTRFNELLDIEQKVKRVNEHLNDNGSCALCGEIEEGQGLSCPARTAAI